jgi:hypothetical protein
LTLEHQQKTQHVFRIQVLAPYWIINRTDLPLQLGQKWTASNVTFIGGQADAAPAAVAAAAAAADTDDMMCDVAEGDARNGAADGDQVRLVGVRQGARGGAERGPGAAADAGARGDASLRATLQGADISPMPFSFHWKVDVGGAKATVRLGPPFLRYSAREGMQVPQKSPARSKRALRKSPVKGQGATATSPALLLTRSWGRCCASGAARNRALLTAKKRPAKEPY